MIPYWLTDCTKSDQPSVLTNIYCLYLDILFAFKMPKVKSMTPEAIAARKRRNSELEVRRFNTTLKEYIELKYDNIYAEYCSFYKSLTSKHPNKKNLLRTSTFKSWKKAVIEQTFQEDGVLAKVTDLVEPSDQESEVNEDSSSEFANFDDNEDQNRIEQESEVNEDSTSEFANFDDNEDQNRIEQNCDQTESTSVEGSEDILSAAINETLSDQRLVYLNKIEDADNIINEIIGEFERDREIQEILAGNDDEVQQHNDDEGIALDYETELDAILEPFDYELELDW